MPFSLGDIFISTLDHDGIFEHWSATGSFIGNITTQTVNGFTGTVSCFAQHLDKLYVMVGHSLGVHIQEYDNNGTYIRTVVTGPDASDPAQNPHGVSQANLWMNVFDLDLQGNFYGGGQTSSQTVWKFDHNGNFIRTFYPVNLTPTQNSIFISPIDTCEIIIVNNVGTPRITRYDACADVIIDTLIPPLGGGGFPSDISCSGKLYKSIGSPSAGTPTGIRVYDPGFSGFTDIDVTKPTGFITCDTVRVTDDDEIVWLWTRTSTGSTLNYNMYQLRTSDNTILQGPISIGQLVGAHVWRTSCPGEEIVLPTYQGLTRFNSDASVQWNKTSGF